MRLSGYMNYLTELAFISLIHDMEYLMHHPHEPIIYSRKNTFKLNNIPYQCLFKAGFAEIKKLSNDLFHPKTSTFSTRALI